MKVAYLFSRYPVPSQTFCDTEMRALEAAGTEVEIFSCSPPASSFRHGPEWRPRAPVFYAPPAPALSAWEAASRRRGKWPAELIAAHEARHGPAREPARRALHALYFADLARRRGVDRLHVHFANRATHAAVFMRALGGPPFSFTAHAQDFMVDLGSDALLGEMCDGADFVVAVSDFSRELLAQKCPGAAARTHRIYNGLEAGHWPAPAPAPADPEGALRVFSVGRLIDFKGFQDLIAACAELRARAVAVRCEIAGDGPLRAELEGLIRERALEDCVSLLGLLPQAEIRRRLQGCDVFALACRLDPRGACDVLPTVITEAMAAGRAVVSTTVAGVPELVADGLTGLLATPGDVPGLADALAILTGRPLRERMGRAGRERFLARFTAHETGRQLRALFEQSFAGAAAPEASNGILAIVPHWPPADGAPLELQAELPGLQLLALTCVPRPALAAAERVGGFDFLPDAMVVESVWREHLPLARRLESWRAELGGAVETEAFLVEARRALYLHLQLGARGPVRHVHALGAGALLVCWLLARLGGVTASFAAERVGTSTLRRLAGGFVGGWLVGDAPAAAALGAEFSGEDAGTFAHAERLTRWAAPG